MFKKEHDILICIDSDGTIMDTMTIKHEICFGPSFIDIFDIKEHKKDILDHWNKVNLYSLDRGINRFQGLKEILIYCETKYNLEFNGAKEFYTWVDTTKAFNVNLLKEIKNNETIEKAVLWSDEVNRRIKLLPESKMFENVYETLKKLSEFADLVGVSSANKEAVLEEWKNNNILPLFKEVYCQDKGSKTLIIEQAKTQYDNNNVIMLGDALGDYNASLNNSCLFYPIIPSQEKESWQELNNISEIIKNKEYKNLEEKYIKEFKDFLGGN